MTITNEEFCALSPQDRRFYLENKDEMEMAVVKGKLCFVVRHGKPVSWKRFHELLQLMENLPEEEKALLRFFTNFNDWNPYSRPYAEYGFYYNMHIGASSGATERAGITQPVKEWLTDWLLAHGFTEEQVAMVRYTGGTKFYGKDGVEETKTYSIEIRCQFTDVPKHYLPEKVHKWLKRNPEWKYRVYGKEQNDAQQDTETA